MHQSATQRLAFPALLLANLVLALGPWLVRLARTESHIGPVAAGFWRLALAAPLLAFIAWRQSGGKPLPRWPLVLAIIVGGLFFAADLAAWHGGILRTKLANATLFGNFASFLFVIYGLVLVRRLPGRLQTAALTLAVIGTALLLGRSFELSPEHFTGDLLALLAGTFYTFYLIAVDQARQTMAPLPVLAIATVVGTAPLLFFAHQFGEQVMPDAWTPVILLSISSQLVGQGLLVYAMGHQPPLVVGLCFLTQPVTAAIVGWAVFDEHLAGADIGGALLICAALVLIRLPDRRVASTPPEAH